MANPLVSCGYVVNLDYLKMELIKIHDYSIQPQEQGSTVCILDFCLISQRLGNLGGQGSHALGASHAKVF